MVFSSVFGKVKTTAGTYPRFMPVGVDIATRGILALSLIPRDVARPKS